MQDLTHGHPYRQHSHAVHFYSDGPEMEAHVAAFIQDGIQAGGTVLTIATKERRDGFAQHLRRAYSDVEGRIDLLSSYSALDADEVLSTFLVDNRTDRSRFFATMHRVFATPARSGRPIRVFGEMVTRLWQMGQPEAAIELEELWNELAQRYMFTLLCAYPLNLFAERDHQRFLDTCATHSRIFFPSHRAAV
ncbi:MAG: MEDS domain-containing protein [Nitrospirota bacterium]|nr:MEDS domain-containing protein [Nitrospirota bacterium]